MNWIWILLSLVALVVVPFLMYKIGQKVQWLLIALVIVPSLIASVPIVPAIAQSIGFLFTLIIVIAYFVNIGFWAYALVSAAGEKNVRWFYVIWYFQTLGWILYFIVER